MKSLVHSKTFWVAVIQAVGGIAIASLTELDLVAYVAICKSLVDIALRMVTEDRIDSVL